jgi:hypothetical protein
MEQFRTAGAIVAIILSIGSAEAAIINVQPIQVCDDAGQNCAAISTFSPFTNKIYAQQGDSINFLPVKLLNSSQYLTLDTLTEADSLIGSTSGTQRSSNAYDMWFVKSIVGGRAGRGAIGGDGVVISNAIIPINRVDTVAHELGHNIGFNHSSSTQIDAARFLMAEGSIREIPTNLGDVAPDGKQLDRFNPILPQVTVDIIGSTPFETTDFFHVKFLTGSAVDVFLKSLTVNLGPAGAFTDPTDSPPGEAGSPFGFSGLNGIAASDITVSGITDGSQAFTLSIAPGAFLPGDEFSFGVDMDLFSAIDEFGATPDQLRSTIITFDFSNGYNVSSSLDDLIASTVFDPTTNYDLPALIFSDPDPLFPSQQPIPEPGTLALFGASFALFWVARPWRRKQ